MWTRRQLAEIKGLLRGNAAIRREAEFDARDEALDEKSKRLDNHDRSLNLTSPAARGSKGGKARAWKLTPAERSAAASRAAKARWRK